MNIERYNVKFLKIFMLFLGVCAICLPLSCKKHKDEKIEKIIVDYLHSGNWDIIFLNESKVFEIGEVKQIMLDNPCEADQCIALRGGSSVATIDEKYNRYLNKGIPENIAEKLAREGINERTNLYFLKNDVIVSSIKLSTVDLRDGVYFTEIGEHITFSIQMPPQLTEEMKNDPNYFEEKPELGQDYLTNPEHLKPIEIVKIE